MSDDGSIRPSLKPSLVPPALAPDDLDAQLGHLQDESAVLESLTQALGRGEDVGDHFARLHHAAVRDNRVVSLVQAYDRATRDHRLRRLQREVQATLLLKAAWFALDVVRDSATAATYAERALPVAVGSMEPLVIAERALALTADAARAAELYRIAASLRSNPSEQLAVWRRAVAWFDALPGASEQALTARERVVKLDVRDSATRAELAREYAEQGRHRDLARLLEEVLAREPGPPPEDAARMRTRLVALYRDQLREPQRALPHLERLLAADPVDESTLEVAESLMESRLLALRLAAVLADAYRRLRRPHDELAVLSREVKFARPPRLGEVQRRLAVLRLDALDDVDGALELLGPLVSAHPGDDDARKRFLDVSSRANKSVEAARLLARALKDSKDEGVRARIGYDLGSLHLSLGDSAAAQAAFEQVAKSGGEEDSVLASARKLVELLGPSGDPKKVARALQVVVRLEPDAKRRHTAARRLGELSDQYELGVFYQMAAWRALVDSPEGADALARLEALAIERKDEATLAEVLELKATRSDDPVAARTLAFRSAELTSKSQPGPAALRTWRRFVERYGPSREAYERMAALLETAGQNDELATVLEAQAQLAKPAERGKLLTRLARLRLEHAGDAEGALQALRRSLEIDSSEPASRALLERLAGEGDVRLQAGEILEPLYRQEGKNAELVQVLHTRAALVENPREQLACLTEAADLLETELADPARGVELCRMALGITVASERGRLREWLDRLGRFSAAAGHPERMAEIVLEVLGEGTRLDAQLLDLALVASEALVRENDTARARELLERALSEDPTSPEILARLDALDVRDRVKPQQRIARHREALARTEAPERWLALMHALANIERKDLRSLDAAAKTLREISARHPEDFAAHLALVEVLEAKKDAAAVDAELERALAAFTGPERQLVLVKTIERLDARGDEQRALELCRSLLEQSELTDAALDVAESLFEKAGDIESAQRVLERRVAAATEPVRRADALERLGTFLLEQLGDSKQAVEAWRTGARICHELPTEVARARRLYERVLDVSSDDREANERLVELYAAAGDWAKVPEVYAACVRVETSDARRVDVLLTLAPQAARAGAADEFIALADEALWRIGSETPGLGRKLMAAKAEVLAALPERHRDASHIFRTLVDSYAEEQDVLAFSDLIDRTADEDVRRESLRWLFEWRTAHTADAVAVLFEWAEVEERRLYDSEGAIAVYERITQREPGNTRALEAIVRLALELDRVERALEALEGLRGASPPSAQAELDVRMATLALDRLDRPTAALPYIGRALEVSGLSEPVLEIARRLLADADARPRAAELLDRAAAAAGAAQGASVRRMLLEATDATPELRDTRRRWWDSLLELVKGDDREALAVSLDAAAELPELEELWTQAEGLAKRAGDLGAVGAAYQRALACPLEPAVAERLGARAADFFEQVLGEPSGAVAALQCTLALAPSARWALDRVKITLTLQRRYEELLELYDRVLEALEDQAAQIELLDEAVVVARDLANEPDVAIRYLERLQPLRTSDTRVEASLERLYERQGHTRRLIELLTRRAETASPREQAELRARIASLWVEIGEPRQALALAEPMLETQPEVALGLLERILRLASVPEEEEPIDLLRAAQRRAARLLSREYERSKRPADVIRVAELELDLLDDPNEKATRLRHIVGVRLETLDDVAGAFESLCTLIRLDPDSPKARAHAAELAQRLGVEERLAEVLIHAAEEADPPRAVLLLEAAQLYADRLDAPDRAVELYMAALRRGREQQDTARRAGKFLDKLLLEQARPAERCTVLEELALLSPEDERQELLAEAARVALQELQDADRAARTWRTVLARDDKNRAAHDGLVQALRAANRPVDLIEALHARARVAPEPQVARRDLVRIAHLYADELGDKEAAANAWRGIRKRFGPDPQSFEALCRLYEPLEKWENLIQLLHEEANAEQVPERRRQLYGRLARLHAEHTGDVVAAIHGFAQAEDYPQAIAMTERALQDPQLCKPALRALAKISTDAWRNSDKSPDSPAARAALWALRALVATLSNEGDHARAVELLVGSARLPFARADQRELRRDAARLAATKLAAPERAIELFRQLFSDDPDDSVARSAMGEYAELLEKASLLADRAELYEIEARGLSADRAEQPWVRAAELWESGANDAERAIAAWQRAAEHGSERAFEALARLHRARGDVRSAVAALDALLERASSDTRADRALRAAEAYLDLDERALARTRLEQALAAGGDASLVRGLLAEVYRAEGAWLPLAHLLEGEARDEWDASRRSQLFADAAKIHSERLGDVAAAVPLLQGAVESAPERHELASELVELLATVGRYDDAVVIVEKRLEAYEGRRPKERALVHQKLGRLLLGAQRPADALVALEQAAQIDPTRTDILFELARLAEQQNRLPEAEQTYRALLLAVRRPSADADQAPTLAEVYLGLSEVARRRDDTRGSADFIESAFEAAAGEPREARGLERALRSMGRDDLLVRAFESRLERAREPADAADALADLVTLENSAAEVAPERVARIRSRAGEVLGALEKQGDGARAWRALHRVFTWLGNGATAAQIAERWAAAIDSEKADPAELYELAGVCLATAERAEQGATLLEAALRREPDPDRALDLLRPAVERDPPSERAARLFEKTCRGGGREKLRAWALSRVASLPTATPADVRTATEHALTVEDAALADAILESAAARPFAPADKAWMLARRSTLAEAAGRTREAVELAERAAESATDTAESAELLRRAASLSLSQLQAPARALALLAKLIDRVPDDESLWDAAFVASDQSKGQRTLSDLLERQAPRIAAGALRHRLLLAHARLLVAQGLTDRALELLKQIVDADTTHAQALELRADLLERSGRTGDLIDLLRSRIEQAWGDAEAQLPLLLQLAHLLERERRSGEALQAYREAIASSSDNLHALRALVRLAESEELPSEELARALERLVELEDETAAARAALRLSQIRAEQGDDAAAERALLDGFERAPSDAELLDELCRRYAEAAQWPKLADVLERALAAKPADRALVLHASEAYRKAGRHDRALELLDTLGREADAAVEYERYLALQAARRRDDALAALEQAARLEADYVDELERELEASAADLEPSSLEQRALGLTALVERAGDKDRAREILRRFAQASPPPRALLERLAKLERAAESWTEAMSAYRRLLQLDLGDKHEATVLALADACERAGRAADARADLERALERAPDSTTLRERLRRLYEKIGARDQLARTYLREAEQADPLARVGALVNAGSLMLESGNVTQAIGALERALEQEPSHIEAALLLAQAHNAAGRRGQALEVLSQVASRHDKKRSKDVARVYTRSAELYLEADELVEALEAFERAFDIDRTDARAALVLGLLALDLDRDRLAQHALQVVTTLRVPGGDVTQGAEGRSLAYYHLGRMARRAGDKTKARTFASRAMREDPGNQDARALLDDLGAAR